MSWCVVACVAAVLTSCSFSSTTDSAEVDDVGDVTVPGVPPTAPPPDVDPASGAAVFIAELEALSTETDLCRILTGDAFSEILSGELDIAALAGTPAGTTRVIVLVDSIFGNLVTIAPVELAPAMTTLDDVWGRVAAIPASSTDAEARVAAILAEPQVVADLDTIGRWAALNCALPAAAGSTTTSPGAPTG